MPMTIGADGTSVALAQGADLQQAEYYWRLLDGLKSEACERLEVQLEALAAFQRAGDLCGVRRHRRIVKVLEGEVKTIDQMLVALRVRLGLPTLRHTL